MNDKLVIQLGKIIDGLNNNPGNLEQAADFVRSAAMSNAPTGYGELKGSIKMEIYEDGDARVAEVYTKKPYAHYVELGTGPKGAAQHSGISPDVNPAYTPHPWWIHESQLEPGIADKYRWHAINTPDGKFYICYGQAAQPFLYPALKNNEQTVLKILKEGYEGIMKETL